MNVDKEIKLGEAGVFRRRMGLSGWAASLFGFLMSGFDFFTINSEHLWAMLITSSGLMGIGIAKNIWGNGRGGVAHDRMPNEDMGGNDHTRSGGVNKKYMYENGVKDKVE